MKFNKTNIDAIQLTHEGQVIYRDSDLIGFAVRATTKSKSYIIERRHEGKLYRVTIGKTNEITVVEARRRAQTILAEISNGSYEKKKQIEKSNPTVQEAFDLYLEHRKLKPLSIQTYNHCLNSFLSDWKKKKIFDITKTQTFDKFLDISKYSESKANLTLKIFGSVWRFSQIHFSTDENPIHKQNPVDVIPSKRGWNKIKLRTRHLTEDQITTYYKAVLNYVGEGSLYENSFKNSVRDLVIFAMYTGCRREEAQSLKWVNVDLNQKEFVFKDPKNGDDHILPMGDHLYDILNERYKLKEGEYVFAGHGGKGNNGGYVRTAKGLFDAVEKETGIYVSMHDLRRTFATICNNLDYGQYTIKRLLNHRSGAKDDVTGGYVQVSLKKLRLAMNDIEAVYQGKLNPFD